MIRWRDLCIAWLLLVVLLGSTVGLSFLLMGPWSLVGGLTIALAKAALIFWIFMQLKELSGLARLVAVAAVAWIAILLLLTAADYVTRVSI